MLAVLSAELDSSVGDPVESSPPVEATPVDASEGGAPVLVLGWPVVVEVPFESDSDPDDSPVVCATGESSGSDTHATAATRSRRDGGTRTFRTLLGIACVCGTDVLCRGGTSKPSRIQQRGGPASQLSAFKTLMVRAARLESVGCTLWPGESDWVHHATFGKAATLTAS